MNDRWANTPPRPAIQTTISPGRRAYAAVIYDLLVVALALIGGLVLVGVVVWGTGARFAGGPL